MDTKALLEQILASGNDLMKQGQNLAEDKLGIPKEGEERTAMLSGLGKGALAAGALGLLLGTRSGRRLGGTAVKLGSLAAVGGLAYKAFQDWQKQNGQSNEQAAQPINQLSGPEGDQRAKTLLRAMIAAAKADGHIDDAELAAIEEKIKTMGIESADAEFFQQEVARPLSVADVVAGVDNTEAAAEVYLASRLVIDMDNAAERKYMEDLAAALKLPADLVANLEAQIV